jgi:hypothetical protein
VSSSTLDDDAVSWRESPKRNETTDDVTDVRVVEKCGIDVSVKAGNRVS